MRFLMPHFFKFVTREWSQDSCCRSVKRAVLWGFHQQLSWIPAERVSGSGPALCCLKKEISGYRKWVGRNNPFKLLPLWDFRDAIMASDKLFGTEPNKIKHSFPSSSLPINLLLFRPSSSGDLCWFVRFAMAEWRTSDYNRTSCQIMPESHK